MCWHDMENSSQLIRLFNPFSFFSKISMCRNNSNLSNRFVFLFFLSFRRIACEGVTQIHPTDLAFYILCLELQLCKPHLVAEVTSPDLRIFANIQECDYAAQGSNVFFNCCLDKGAPRLSSQGQNPCKFRRLLMGLFSSWTSCLQRFVSFNHCCILFEKTKDQGPSTNITKD